MKRMAKRTLRVALPPACTPTGRPRLPVGVCMYGEVMLERGAVAAGSWRAPSARPHLHLQGGILMSSKGAVLIQGMVFASDAWMWVRQFMDSRRTGWQVESGVRWEAGRISEFIRGGTHVTGVAAYRLRLAGEYAVGTEVVVTMWPDDEERDQLLGLVERLGGRWAVTTGLYVGGEETHHDVEAGAVRAIVEGVAADA